MTGIIDWAAERARMIIAFIVLSLVAGAYAYLSLPKEGEPDIEIPALFVSVPFPGISAADAEKLLVKPMETELSDLDGPTIDVMSDLGPIRWFCLEGEPQGAFLAINPFDDGVTIIVLRGLEDGLNGSPMIQGDPLPSSHQFQMVISFRFFDQFSLVFPQLLQVRIPDRAHLMNEQAFDNVSNVAERTIVSVNLCSQLTELDPPLGLVIE